MSQRVLFVTSELTPIVKVGGLGDVAGALPKALHEAGIDVRVLLPLYGTIDQAAYPSEPVWTELSINTIFGATTVSVRETHLPGSSVPLYLLDWPEAFGQGGVYFETPSADARQREWQRFAAYSQAVVDLLPQLSWQPDIVHCQDWHTGLIPALIHDRALPYKTALTIHNLQNQGRWSSAQALGWLGASVSDKITGLRDQYDNINLLQLGIHFANRVTTVSPTYAQEILQPDFGETLEKDLGQRPDGVIGIINGIDDVVFDPAHDSRIIQPYNATSAALGKQACKVALQQSLGLDVHHTAPLFAIVSRLTEQKGLSLLVPVLEQLIATGSQLVVLGSGQPEIEAALQAAAERHPASISVALRFDANLAQQIYAGADFFLMPSKFEPCGLGQMIAQRYGTIPIVRSTGGLRDTVSDVRNNPDTGTGISFDQFASADLWASLQAALDLYHQPAQFAQLRERIMGLNHSWATSAQQYISMYANLPS